MLDEKRGRGRPKKEESNIKKKEAPVQKEKASQPEKPRDDLIAEQANQQWSKIMEDGRFKELTEEFRKNIVKYYQDNPRLARETGDVVSFIKKGRMEKTIEPFHRVLNDALAMFAVVMRDIEFDKGLKEDNSLRNLYKEYKGRLDKLNEVYNKWLAANLRKQNGVFLFADEKELEMQLYLSNNFDSLYEILAYTFSRTTVFSGLIKKEESELEEEINLGTNQMV